jgi:hypothetical protein
LGIEDWALTGHAGRTVFIVRGVRMGRRLGFALAVCLGFVAEAKEPVSFEGALSTLEAETIYRDLRASMGEPLAAQRPTELRRRPSQVKSAPAEYRIRLIAKKQKPEQ